MELELYTSDLLYRYECVTIPNLGAFLTQTASASIDDASNTFNPPKKTVSFNEQIQKNDGLLAHYIADVEKIPFDIAQEKIAKRVQNIKTCLAKGESIPFKNIGTLAFNVESKLVFEPTYHINYLTHSFGLAPLVSPIVSLELHKTDIEAVEKVIPLIVIPEKRKSKPYFKYAAVALIALTLGVLASSKYYTNQIELHNQIAQEKAIKQLDAKIEQATFNLSPLPAITLDVTKRTGNYHVIAGAFRVEDNCEQIVSQLKSQGFKARTIGVNKYGLHEVVYGSYETGEEALEVLRNVRKIHNPDAWLLIKDLTLEAATQ